MRLPSRITSTLFAQVLGLTLVVLCLAEAINTLIVFNLPPPTPVFYTQTEIEQALRREPATSRTADQLIVRQISAAQARPDEHPGQVRFRESVARDMAISPDALVITSSSADRYTVRELHEAMRAAGHPQGGPGQPHQEGFLIAPFKLDMRRADGQWIEVTPPRHEFLEPWQQHILIWFGLSFLAVVPFSYLFARRLAAPITWFAAAADRLGRDPRAPPLSLPKRGGAEIRLATHAFNDMQERLRRYVEDRTSMIGAIAHDLRTPLTRLRFRVESAPEDLREKMTADMDQMEAMIAATLAFVRDTATEPKRTKLELSSLLESVTDDMAETGANVRLEDSERVVINADSLALRRLFSNLLENAVKFGGAARARLFIENQAAVVEVQDDGPGVPESELERVFAPFYRREPSRNRKTGGIGLGLSVARSIARSHGGELVLVNRPGGGLTARATLPV
ncbi:MAG TPA: ATP-binding protein [Caulobacteraceae bacterium]|nr:ATP-binding protein [Caulobacteraceae bacterium]